MKNLVNTLKNQYIVIISDILNYEEFFILYIM